MSLAPTRNPTCTAHSLTNTWLNSGPVDCQVPHSNTTLLRPGSKGERSYQEQADYSACEVPSIAILMVQDEACSSALLEPFASKGKTRRRNSSLKSRNACEPGVSDRSTGFVKTSDRGVQIGKEAAHWLLRVFSSWECPGPFPDQGKDPSSR